MPHKSRMKGFTTFKESQGKTVAEAEKALNHYNFLHSDTTLIAQKATAGLYVIDYIDGTETPLSATNLRTMLTQKEFFWHYPAKSEDDSPREKQPEPAVFKSLVTLPPRDKPSVPVYTGLHYGALMHPDGTIRSHHGLDDSTQVVCVKDIDVPAVPEHPTDVDIIIAKEHIYNLLREFRFKIEDGEPIEHSVAYQNAVFMLIACVLRPSIRGAFPLFVIDKNMERLGASLLSDTICTMAYGHTYPKLTFSTKVEENEKAFKAKLTESPLFCAIDNIVTPKVRGAEEDWVFPSLLTATTGGEASRVDFRKLGTNELIHVEPKTIFAANGINVKLSADITGRVIVTTLESTKSWQELPPLERTKDELLKAAAEAHPTIIASIATMFRRWIDMGRPEARHLKGNVSEYQDLVNIIGGVMSACGYNNYLGNLEEIQTTRNDKDYTGKIVLETLYERFGLISFTPKDVKTYLIDTIDTSTYPEIEEPLAYIILSTEEVNNLDKLAPSRLGTILKQYHGPYSGCSLLLTSKRANKGIVYQIVDQSLEEKNSNAKGVAVNA